MKVSLTTALVAIGYAALIHKTDAAVRYTAKRMVKQVSEHHRRIILGFLNHPQPYLFTKYYFAELPEHILTMEIKYRDPAAPV